MYHSVNSFAPTIEIPKLHSFENIDAALASFKQPDFTACTTRRRFRKVNQTLCDLIVEAPPHSFLLGSLLEFIERVNKDEVLQEPFTFSSFEFWLNNFSGLSDKDNFNIRAKIAGRMLPRSDYQAFFPVGMDRVYTGSHFVAAHLSPDVDTMIASFWGWLDAFSARIGTGLHYWCLPGGPPDSPVTSIMIEMFGSGLFNSLARTSPALTLTALDLVTQQRFIKEHRETLTGDIDHGSNEKAIILVNEQGHYLGDWRTSDIEVVRQIIIPFKSCLRWFENNLHTKLISLFAKPDLSIVDFPSFYSSIFDVRIKDCEPALEFNEKQKADLHDFFVKLLGVENGLEGTFKDLINALAYLPITELSQFQEKVEALPKSDIFDENGKLREDRPKIFNRLEKIINRLDAAIHNVRNYVERLDVVIGIKHKVLRIPPVYITLRSDVDEMRQKLQNQDFLTVVIHEQDGALFPVGIVHASDLRQSGLGTVSLRDFCNLEEVRMASYLEVISVVDHHKSALRTLSVPSALIGDAQSCNVLIAEQTFLLNDQYSLGGMKLEQIENQLSQLAGSLETPSQTRIFQRLLQRRLAAQHNSRFFIHPARELTEYLCHLHAILDDTDLLTKVSNRDLNCVAQLLNRLKSLSIGREVEIIHFDDIPKDKFFTKSAAKRILQQEDMYSLYRTIYDFRESSVELNLGSCIDGHYSNIFLDAKEQNGCARVGQTKLFSSNFSYYLEHSHEIRKIWLAKSEEVYKEHGEIDLHLHMISTIASAEEVYRDAVGPYSHQDELWFWVPQSQASLDHLNSFLAGFQHIVTPFRHTLSLEFLGEEPHNYVNLFKHNFPEVPYKETASSSPYSMAILRFKAGALNSRKSMITPFLPRLLS
ncbi:MAG: hypothetical protein LW832_02335 [Parachlamydia sp.]|jgi:hypothetical protein|nr:hypothetical protein [Parachlamydia sp.]